MEEHSAVCAIAHERRPREAGCPRHTAPHHPLRSPRVDVRALLACPSLPLTGPLVKQRGDPASRVRWVDHVIDLAVCRHVQALAVLICRGNGGLEYALALIWVL